MNAHPVKTIAAAGYVAGCLAARGEADGLVLPVTDDDGHYTGEVRFQFLGEWYSVACPTPIEAP